MTIEDRIILDSTIDKKTAGRLAKLLDRHFKDSGFDTSYISYEFSNNGILEITPSDKWVDEWEWINPYALDASDGEELEPEEEIEAESTVKDENESQDKKAERRDDFDARKLESGAVIDTFIEKLTSWKNTFYHGKYRTITASSWEVIEEGLKNALVKIKITEKVDMRAVKNDPTYTPPRLADLKIKYVEKPTPAYKRTRKPAEDIELVEPPRTRGRPAEAKEQVKSDNAVKPPGIDINNSRVSAAIFNGKKPPKLTPKAFAVISGEPTFRQRNLAKVQEILGLGNGDAPKTEPKTPPKNGAETKTLISFPKEPPQAVVAINSHSNLHKRITVLKGVKLSGDQVGIIATNLDKYFKDRGVSVSGIRYKFGVTEQLNLKFIIIGDNIPSYDPSGTNTDFQIARRDLLTENGERILRHDFSTTGYSVSASTWKGLLTGLDEKLGTAAKGVAGR